MESYNELFSRLFGLDDEKSRRILLQGFSLGILVSRALERGYRDTVAESRRAAFAEAQKIVGVPIPGFPEGLTPEQAEAAVSFFDDGGEEFVDLILL